MAVNPMTGLLDTPVPEVTLGPDQACPGTRPPEIGDEELRVEDLMAWLEGMDPLKTVRIVMATKGSVVASDIHTITEEAETVDIFPTKMPNPSSHPGQDLRKLLAERAHPKDWDQDSSEKEEDEECDEAQIILDAIRRRKKMRTDEDCDRVAAELAAAAKAGVNLIQYREMVQEKEQDRRQRANRRRERLTGAE